MPFFHDPPSPPPVPDPELRQPELLEVPGPALEREVLPRRAPRPSSAGEAVYTLLFGTKGMGKTTYARQVWWARRRAGGSGIFFDPKAENSDMGDVVHTPQELRETIGRALQERRPFAAVVQLDWNEDAEAFWHTIFKTGNLLLVLDEAQDHAGLDTNTRSGVLQIVGKGRSRGIDLLSTVRTPPELHKQLRGNQDVVITFRQSERDYAEGLASRYFPGPGMTERILALPQFHYLRSQHGSVSTGKVQI